MKKTGITVLILGVIVIFMVIMIKKENTDVSPLVGKWVSEDDKTVVLDIKDNGSAKVNGQKISKYFAGDNTLDFKDGNRVQKCMYELDGAEMVIYMPYIYLFEGDGTPEGIWGIWKSIAPQKSFEFQPDGLYVEDECRFGSYTVSDSEKCIYLVQTGQESKKVFFEKNGTQLIIYYPQRLVRR